MDKGYLDSRFISENLKKLSNILKKKKKKKTQNGNGIKIFFKINTFYPDMWFGYICC